MITAIIIKLPPSPVNQSDILEYPLFNHSIIINPLPLTLGISIRVNLCSRADESVRILSEVTGIFDPSG
jgi:hypothetical protein